MAPCGDGRDDDWYQYGLDDFPPLCSAPPPLALLSAEDYRLPIAAAPPPGHLRRSDGGGLIEGSCHGALAGAAADCPSSALMSLRGDESYSYYDLPIFSAPPPPAGEPYFSNQLPRVPVDGATVGLDDALLLPLGDIDLEAFDSADEHKMIPPAGQHTVGQDYAGVDVVHEDQKPMAIADSFRPRANALELTMSRHGEHQKSSSVAAALVPPPPPPLPRPRGRRSVDHRSAPAHGKTRLDHIGFDELRKYFYMPITRAARELNVGLTVLKKRCRELGIARWPHRKMKSLKSLILNVQEMGTGMNPAAVQHELAALETYCALMEENPAIELTERTKKLRQACFKESYKRRRAAAVNVMDRIFSFDDHKYRHPLRPPPPPSSAERHGHGSSFLGY
ncbi:uncharacterized protein LOC112892548 [Panicum hallii]|uniref:uncharacterized protein LOC112892548 n=1 Tax=Panicum hallii TaxID=206008 RepID=UPI000DF4DA3F|nr:uncharacterized protein LOC112892548 [Panicum hallii]